MHSSTPLRRTGSCTQGRHEVAAALARPINEIEQALQPPFGQATVLFYIRMFVSPWVIHPFSLSPTATWGPARRARLVGTLYLVWIRNRRLSQAGNAVIHARIGGEDGGTSISISSMTRLWEKSLWVAFRRCHLAPPAWGQRPPFLRHRSALPASGRCPDRGVTDMVFLPDLLLPIFPGSRAWGGEW